MSANEFNTANQTLRQLFGNGLRYRVPRFQRDYSWTEDEWDDLWHDIQGTLPVDGEPAHYMGYLVLQTSDNKAFDIIDGQQRLTTLSLLALAVLNELQGFVDGGIDTDNNRRRGDQLRNQYIGYLDPVSLVPHTKLSLNRNNDGLYRDFIVPLRPLPKRGLRASEQQLRKAFEWLVKRVRESYGVERNGVVLARFLDSIADKLFFTVINVTDELNAFKVFETLNARGVRLSPTDLLKNYLFSVVFRETAGTHEIDALERRWESMVGSLGGESFPDFLRVHWNSRRSFLREADLFKTIRAQTPGKAEVFELLRQMEEDIGVYAALSSPTDVFWAEAQRRHVRELRVFSVRQPWPLLLAAYRVFDTTGWAEVARACAIVSFRYNVIGGLAANEQERSYNAIARRIANGDLTQPGDVIRAMAPIYIDDDAFRLAFANKVLRTSAARNRNIARYLLFQLERQISGQDLDEDSARYTLEHVLPENPEQHWPQFSDEQADDAIYRLGNLTLLEASSNRDLGNSGYATKRVAYHASGISITRSIAIDNDSWDSDRVAVRQHEMAKQATAIWRIAQLARG
jgi:hypothetical protein